MRWWKDIGAWRSHLPSDINTMAVRLNYPEMLQQVKMTLFTGNHSAIYSLACAVACIACSFALITWYNKMMNDPYGRLDVRAVVKAVLILLLTCNFYNFVLVPFDHITYLVTRGLSASVDERRSKELTLEEMVREIESSRGEETFLGGFLKDMDGERSSVTEDSGIIGDSSSVLESDAEVRIMDGPKKGFGKRIWQAAKDVVSGIFAFPVVSIGSALSLIISLLVKIVQWVLMAVSSIYLIILGLVGPFVFALSLMPGFERGIHNWIARYIQISFWTPMAALVDFVNYKLTGALVTALFNAPLVAKNAYTLHLILLEIVVLVCLIGVPSMASWVISSAGASDLNRSIAGAAQKAAMIALK